MCVSPLLHKRKSRMLLLLFRTWRGERRIDEAKDSTPLLSTLPHTERGSKDFKPLPTKT